MCVLGTVLSPPPILWQSPHSGWQVLVVAPSGRQLLLSITSRGICIHSCSRIYLLDQDSQVRYDMRARISNREWILSELFPLPAELSAAAAPPPRMCAVVYHLWPLKVSQIIIITYAREAAAQDSLLCGSILWNLRKLCENSADFIDFSFFNRPDQNTVPSIPSSPSLRMGIWGLLKTFGRRSFRVLIKIIILFLVSVLCGDCVLCVIYQVRARSPVNQCQSASQWAPWSPLSRLCPPLLHSISCWLAVAGRASSLCVASHDLLRYS